MRNKSCCGVNKFSVWSVQFEEIVVAARTRPHARSFDRAAQRSFTSQSGRFQSACAVTKSERDLRFRLAEITDRHGAPTWVTILVFHLLAVDPEALW
jgi:hypothetical protein